MAKAGRFLILCMLLGASLLAARAHAKVYADKSKKIYHTETCPEKDQIKPAHLRIFDSEPEAESRGFYPCKTCVPPAGQPSLTQKEEKKLALPVTRELTYVGDKKSKIYHNSWCPLAEDIPAGQRRVFSSAKTAHAEGYDPCTECNPPALFQRLNEGQDYAPEVVLEAPKPPDPNQGQSLDDE